MAKRWLSARIYYSPLDMNAPGDPQSDTILLDFIDPAIRHMRAEGWVEWATFMRFAEAGYHIYLTVYGEEETIKASAGPYLRAEFTRFRSEHPEIMQEPMVLSPNAETLNRKWGSPAEPRKLVEPGTLLMGLLPEEVDTEGYETREAWAAQHSLHTALCRHTLDLIRLDPTPQLRNQFVRLLMDDFLRLSGLADSECYTVLRRLQQGWIDYFELKSDLLERMERLYRQKEERYQGFFRGKQRPEESLSMLPAELQPVYAEWLTTLRELGPQVIRREGGQKVTAFDAQRIIGVFHLTHNRLSIKLEDEILTAHILAQYYGSLVDPAKRAEIDDNLARRAQPPAPAADATAGE
jgi:hypothetical protein